MRGSVLPHTVFRSQRTLCVLPLDPTSTEGTEWIHFIININYREPRLPFVTLRLYCMCDVDSGWQ